jgi:ubiquinone/menaquinone biosynthesis C-methylase UbiE
MLKINRKYMKFLELILPASEYPREQWLVKQLKHISKGKKIIDAGAGECYYEQYCQHLHYTSQDFNQYNGIGDHTGIQTGTRNRKRIDIVSDITEIPVKSRSYDVILCVEVFEHIPNPYDALKEFSRILKKGGTLLLTAPRSSLTHYSPYYYFSGFSEQFYIAALPQYGFNIEKIYTYGNYFDSLALELLRVPIICFRSRNLINIALLILYPLAIPVFFLLRFFAILMPKSKELLSFGHCIRARKIM